MSARLNILHVVGARPNFMKIAPVMRALDRAGFAGRQRLVHTGQHYDAQMSDVFFEELGLPRPDVHLGVGSGSHAQQTAAMLVGLEAVCSAQRPDLVLVAGDVNSTLAASLVAAKACIPCAHLEAGLRSFDRSMPEEVNRLVTDRLAELLLTPSQDADANLLAEGVAPSRIVRVGNVMVDSLLQQLPAARAGLDLSRYGVARGHYAVVTLHRPVNVDAPERLAAFMRAFGQLARRLPVIFPVHPRTRKQLEVLSGGVFAHGTGLTLCEPLGYREFLGLFSQACCVITDSGGVQEETTALGIPCLTLRETTERPVTVTLGTNSLIGSRPERVLREAERVLEGRGKRGRVPPLWDGRAAERVVSAIEAFWRRRVEAGAAPRGSGRRSGALRSGTEVDDTEHA